MQSTQSMRSKAAYAAIVVLVILGAWYFARDLWRRPAAHPGFTLRLTTPSLAAAAKAETLSSFGLIEPMWREVKVYGGPDAYQGSLAAYSLGQRSFFAIHWYWSEVRNGGHAQLFSNASGIVWQDALAGFEAIGLGEGAAILREASARLGGASLEQAAREAQLEQLRPDFSDLDARLSQLFQSGQADARMQSYAKEHPQDFK